MIKVLYHGNCYDGFGAAYAAWKYYGDRAEYIPVSYGQEPPDVKDCTVYILDFSYKRDVLLKMKESALSLFVIDHHKTAEEDLNGLEFCHFDMNHSGAWLTWVYFNPICQDGVTSGEYCVPELIRHIEDRDLWRFKLDRSKEIHKALVSYPMDFKLWDTFNIENLKAEGAAMERLHNQLVENICASSWIGKLGEDDVPMVNTSIAWSEVGHCLLQKYPNHKYVASFTEFEKETMWSLRSREDFDCSEVARKFGGGGHRQASGFKNKK